MEHPLTVKTGIWPSGRLQLLFGKKPERMPQFVWRRIHLLRLIGNTMMAVVLLYPVALCASHFGVFNDTILQSLGRRLYTLEVFVGVMCVPYLEWLIILVRGYCVRYPCLVASWNG